MLTTLLIAFDQGNIDHMEELKDKFSVRLKLSQMLVLICGIMNCAPLQKSGKKI